ncbi:GNAT family N-acetyltransferase [Psychrobacter sp.]|uniref:GNAT family N-acetyltransferase n=1 Tax=Psychrobacter sp. TaxID=56811 RepID=UPI003BB0939F
MSDMASHAILPILSKHNLTDQFIVQRASDEDLSEILVIYNQSIAGKQATANLEPVTHEERATWFAEHISSATRPIYVVRAVDKGIHSNNRKELSPIVAWGSFSDLYARPAYHISSEISIYLHKDYHGQGLGSLLAHWMLEQAPSLGIYNIVALIFAHNQPSLGLFRKLGFEQWGCMPQVCDMNGFIADVVMLGKSLVTENAADDNNKR